MSKLNNIAIGNNIKRLRIATDLSQHELSTLIPISKRSIAKIELGDPNLSVSKLNLLLDFFDLRSLTELSTTTFSIDNNIREKLAIHHRTVHPEYLEFLTKVPGIVYAIDFKLVPSNFLSQPRLIHEIREYFKELGWNFSSSSLTNALLRKPDQIIAEKLNGAKNINLYSKKERK